MEKKAPPFLLEKWPPAFYFFDKNKDGVITLDDAAAMGDYIAGKIGSGEAEGFRIRQTWVKHYELLQPDKYHDTFIERNKELFKNVEYQREVCKMLANDIFDVLDLGQGGKISMDGLAMFYGALGLTDSTLVKPVFKHLDQDGDGFIQKKDLAEDIIRHYADPDSVTGQACFIPPVMTH